jgi:hypothetical protein
MLPNALNSGLNPGMVSNPNIPPNMNEHGNYLGMGLHSGHHQMMAMGQNPAFQSSLQQFPGQMQAPQQGEYPFAQMMPPTNMQQPGMFYPPEFQMNPMANNNFAGHLIRSTLWFT